MVLITQRYERYRHHVYVEPSIKYSTFYKSVQLSSLMTSSSEGKKKAKIIGKESPEVFS